MKIINSISVDVEDYFQVSAFEHAIDRKNWCSLEHRVEQNVEKTLALCAENNTKATFFTLGWVAERYPRIIQKIVSEGHELASHGYGHQRVHNLTKKEFETDVAKAKQILEDVGGQHIRGYRAPSYSIGRDNVWALDVLAETGHCYSSSIYPIQHDHYGFPGAPRFAFRDERSGIIEIPITTVKIVRRLVPAGGGGFFRFYPYVLSRWMINQVNNNDQKPLVFYFHPWELDPDQPRQNNIPVKTRFRHYINLNKTESRLKRLLRDFKWDRMDQVYLDDENIPTHRLT